MPLRDGGDDGQTEAAAAGSLHGGRGVAAAVEAVEDPPSFGRRNAGAGVADDKAGRAVDRRGHDVDRAAARRVAKGVVDAVRAPRRRGSAAGPRRRCPSRFARSPPARRRSPASTGSSPTPACSTATSLAHASRSTRTATSATSATPSSRCRRACRPCSGSRCTPHRQGQARAAGPRRPGGLGWPGAAALPRSLAPPRGPASASGSPPLQARRLLRPRRSRLPVDRPWCPARQRGFAQTAAAMGALGGTSPGGPLPRGKRRGKPRGKPIRGFAGIRANAGGKRSL